MSTIRNRHLTEYQFLIDDEVITTAISLERKSAVIGLKKRNVHNLRKNWSIAMIKGSKMNDPNFEIS